MELKTIKTKKLEIAYLEDGPKDGQIVLCLHGFPDTAQAFEKIMTLLSEKGYRTIAPFVRGVLPTQFLDTQTPRAGDQTAQAQDALDFIDTLHLDYFSIIGHDWGNATAEIVASLRPKQVAKLLKIGRYGIFLLNDKPETPGFNYKAIASKWYIWMLCTKMGEAILNADTKGFIASLWEDWSSTWNAQERNKQLEKIIDAFNTDDFKRIVLSSYRAKFSTVDMDTDYDDLRTTLLNLPPIICKVKTVYGMDDSIDKVPFSKATLVNCFEGGYAEVGLKGVGHFAHRELPGSIVEEFCNF